MLVKTQKISAFSRRYEEEINKWSLHFDLTTCPILAVSRKGPRLIELLHQDGFFGKEVLDRTCSEYAIPFLSGINILSVIDDSVLYGSTLKDVIGIIEKKFGVTSEHLNIVPFRYSFENADELKQSFDQKFSVPISSADLPVHINQLIHSFKKLGKPYDLEFPIIYLKGDFSNRELLVQKLEEICGSLGDAHLIPNVSPGDLSRYTLLVRGSNNRKENANAEFSKFRIYVGSDQTQLVITPISPCIISNEDLISFDEKLPEAYRHLWTDVLKKVDGRELDETDWRSLIVWANYLKSLSFLTNRLKYFEKYFDIDKLSFDIYDLRLLLGFELPEKLIGTLENVLKAKKKFVTFEPNYTNFVKIREYKVPKEYETDFFTCCDQDFEMLKQMGSESEILNHFFHCQHIKIELASRSGSNYFSTNRLKFGFTLNYIIELVKKYIPEISITNIHAAFDRLIDLGAVVPKYLNLSTQDDKIIWGRVYRVGEGAIPTSKKILVLSTMFRFLSEKFGESAIPAVVLEKFTVLGLTQGFGFKELSESGVSSLEIKKVFGLYGARSYVTTDANGEGMHLLEWAKTLKVITQDKDKYAINDTVVSQYELDKPAISTTVKDKLDDIASFCHHISKEQTEAPLVLFTTLASEKEYWLAVSAELNLWVNHRFSSIYQCLHKLGEIRNLETNRAAQIIECNNLLSVNANFTAQVIVKNRLYRDYEKIISATDESVSKSANSGIKRVWRDLKENLQIKKDSKDVVYLNEILAILRVCHTITSLCRTLLDKAGNTEISSQQKPISVQLKLILRTLENSEKECFLLWHRVRDKGLVENVKDVIVKYEDTWEYEKSCDELLPFLRNIADFIFEILNLFGVGKETRREVLTIPPPAYIVMWDIRNSSTDQSIDRSLLEKNVILPINEQIKKLLSSKKLEDLARVDVNDGNSFITSSFADAIMAFTIISKIADANRVKIRVGCTVNLEGELHVYPDMRIIGGRTYEFASRTLNFFKEIAQYPDNWSGKEVTEPDECYMIVSEFVKRLAIANGEWNHNGLSENPQSEGLYNPRIKKGARLPYSVSILTNSK